MISKNSQRNGNALSSGSNLIPHCSISDFIRFIKIDLNRTCMLIWWLTQKCIRLWHWISCGVVFHFLTKQEQNVFPLYKVNWTTETLIWSPQLNTKINTSIMEIVLYMMPCQSYSGTNKFVNCLKISGFLHLLLIKCGLILI